MKNKTKINRYKVLDFLRGLAVAGMIVFHILFILNFYKHVQLSLYEGGYLILARSVQITFITLVGICMAISRRNRPVGFYPRQIKRIIKIALAAALVTLGTYYTEPDVFVRFGILHFMAVGSLLAMAFSNQKNLSLLLAAASYFIGNYLQALPPTPDLAPTILGIRNTFVGMLDLFPIFPWISLVFLGISLGHLAIEKRLFERPLPTLDLPILKPIYFLGHYALFVYLIHVPLILLVLKIVIS